MEGGALSQQSVNNERQFAGGNGTANDPYKIATAEQLEKFAELVNDYTSPDTDACAVLTADINLSGVGNWTPIGDSSNNQYSGSFDGDGHTISGLNIAGSDDYQGLFGYVYQGGTVQNLTVDGTVSGAGTVGGIVAQNYGTIQNCTNTGTVTGTYDYVGGVVGYNSGSVENCYNTGTVSGGVVGGVVGYNSSSSTVENCYNTGAVNSSGSNVGGVVGYNNGGTVTNCYNTGSVSGSGSSSFVGGVVGGNDEGTVENCYNIGEVSGSGTSSYVGGVVGWNDGTVTNCYNTGIVTGPDSGTSNKGGVVGLNSGTVTGCYFLNGTAEDGIGSGEDAEGAAAVTNLDELCENFKSDPWTISENLDRPVLKDNHEDDGSEQHPYEIFTATQLENFRDLVNGPSGQVKDSDAHAKLMNDINLSSVCGPMLDDGQPVSWIPIGTSSSNPYEGTFNGAGHTISGLYINSSSDSNQGLFGYVSGSGKIEKLSVSGTVSGGMYVGGVVGRNGGNVINCTFSGSVSGFGPVGGVVGSNNNGSVENCYNTGSVTGSADIVGGVVGYNSRSVTNCYNTGTVSGGEDVGGVVGHNDGGSGSGTVTNCYFLQTADVNVGRPGIGDGSGTSSNVEARTADAFHSGEVTWRLQDGQADGSSQVWGQSNLTATTSLPTLVALDKANAQKVYQVTFDYGTSFADNDGRYAYSYTNGVVSEPTKNPELAGHTLSGWYSDPSLTTAWTFDTEISNDKTLYAKWTPVAEPDPDPEPTPDPEPEEPPYSGKYSYEVSTSVGDHGSLTVDRYATEGDTVTIQVTPDQAYKLDDLTVTAHGKDVELTANSDGTYTFTMPSADVKITATFAEDPDWTEPEEPATDVSDIFLDVAPNAWYKDAIQYAYDNGLMTGVSATEFAPEQTTTRAMIVSILARLENVTTAEAAGFADVDDEWYATAVNWAANVGVVNGYEDNTFQPNTAITREQLAAILMNYAAYKGEDVSNRADLANYTDQPSTWANEAMQWAVAEGLISGVTNTELQPQGEATRAQVAAILQRFLTK